MALDEPNDTDETIEAQGFTFVVERELYNRAKPIKVDMTYLGFHITSAMPLSDKGGCGGTCSC